MPFFGQVWTRKTQVLARKVTFGGTTHDMTLSKNVQKTALCVRRNCRKNGGSRASMGRSPRFWNIFEKGRFFPDLKKYMKIPYD